MPGIRPAHPARPLGPGGAVADQQVRLGLAVELVQPHAEPLAAPRSRLLADRLAAARDRPQRHRHAVAAAHHPQRRRGHEDVADAGVGDHVERHLGVEARRAEGNDGDAVREARHDDVVEAADPGPVGRRPDAVARLREEVVRELEAGQVAGQHAVAVERALRRAGRAGGVDEQRGRVRRRRGRREVGRGGGEQGVEVVVDVDRDAVEAELGRALERRALGDDRARLRATKAHAERIAAEGRAQRHHDRAELVDRDMGDHGLGPLREDQRHPVARATPLAASAFASRLDASRQLAEGDRAGDLAPVGDEDRRRRRRLAVRRPRRRC